MATTKKKISALPIASADLLTKDDFLIINDGNTVTTRTTLLEASTKLGIGYEVTGGFKGKQAGNSYVWTTQPGDGITYTQADVDAGLFKVFELDYNVHLQTDGPYWTSDPAADVAMSGSGLFGNSYAPMGVAEGNKGLIDFETVFTDGLYANGDGIAFTGSLDLRDCQKGDQLRVRFDFNVIPIRSNTTVEPALWYANATAADRTPTFRFPLTTQPIFFGENSAGKSYLNRVEISAWIAGDEDINSISLPAIKADNPVIIQPNSMMVTILR